MTATDRVTVASHEAAAVSLSAARRRIGGDEPRAWVAVAEEHHLTRWRPPHGLLSGLTFGVKDIVDLEGFATRCGSQTTSDREAEESAPFVSKLIAAGAVPAGKTVTTEYAYFTPGPTRNPRVPGHTPGGSSSGSAAAVAAGHVEFAVGSQTAGSLIRPAAYCGVFGLVFTRGTQPTDGFSGLARSLDAPGVFAQDAGILQLVARALGVATLPGVTDTVYVWSGDEQASVSPGMGRAVRDTAKALAAAGIDVRRIPLDAAIRQLAVDHAVIMAFEVAEQRPDLVRLKNLLSPPLAMLIDDGRRITSREYSDAVARTAETRARVDDLLRDGAVILGPGAPGPAPAGLSGTGSPIMSRPWQSLGLPQLNVPGRETRRGRPLGVQLIGAAGAETPLLVLADQLGKTSDPAGT